MILRYQRRQRFCTGNRPLRYRRFIRNEALRHSEAQHQLGTLASQTPCNPPTLIQLKLRRDGHLLFLSNLRIHLYHHSVVRLPLKTAPQDLLFVGEIDLETFDITILDFALRKCHLWLHDLYHPWFYFLWRIFRLEPRGRE